MSEFNKDTNQAGLEAAETGDRKEKQLADVRERTKANFRTLRKLLPAVMNPVEYSSSSDPWVSIRVESASSDTAKLTHTAFDGRVTIYDLTIMEDEVELVVTPPADSKPSHPAIFDDLDNAIIDHQAAAWLLSACAEAELNGRQLP